MKSESNSFYINTRMKSEKKEFIDVYSLILGHQSLVVVKGLKF